MTKLSENLIRAIRQRVAREAIGTWPMMDAATAGDDGKNEHDENPASIASAGATATAALSPAANGELWRRRLAGRERGREGVGAGQRRRHGQRRRGPSFRVLLQASPESRARPPGRGRCTIEDGVVTVVVSCSCLSSPSVFAS